MNRIVVADAGPLHYLILIDCVDVLPKLFERVFIPAGVRDELVCSGAPEKVRTWIDTKINWLLVESLKNPLPVHGLHQGEAEALQLALQISATCILMDDYAGRSAARHLSIPVIGTIGLLERAAELDLIGLPIAIAKLRATNFFASPELLEAALQRERDRRKS